MRRSSHPDLEAKERDRDLYDKMAPHYDRSIAVAERLGGDGLVLASAVGCFE